MKLCKWMLLPMFAMVCGLSFVACGDDSEPEPKTNDPDAPTPIVQGKVLSPQESKERLSTIGKEFLNKIPASDFEDILSLTDYIYKTYCQDDADELADWAKDCLDALTHQFVRTDRKEDNGGWGDYVYNYVYIYNYTRRIYDASQFRAHVEWKNGAWRVTQKNTSDLQFSCTDRNGQQVVARLVTSGNTKRVYVGEIERDYHSDYQNFESAGIIHYNSTYTYDKDLAYAEVPEQIDVTVTQGGKVILSASVKTDLSSMSGTDFNLSKDKYGVEASASVAGYTFKNIRASAKANTADGAEASVTIEKGGRELLKVSARGEVDLRGGVYGENSDTEVEVNGGGASAFLVDILGQLQVKGKCTDVKGFLDALEDANRNTDEQKAKSLMKKANGLINAELYYDNTSTRQAYVMMDVFSEQRYDGTYRWKVQPLICFEDGSSYSMSDESYFSESAFRGLINIYENLLKDYEDLADKYEDLLDDLDIN